MAVLENAARGVDLDEAQRLKYTASVLHQVIANDTLQVEDAHVHVFCSFREIEGLPQDCRAVGYLDLDESGDVDQQAHKRLLRLSSNVSDYRATWTARWHYIKS